MPTAEQYPGADAVLLDDDIEVRYGNDALTGHLVVEETVHVRARILREGGARIAHVQVGYDPAFSSVTSFAARTVSPQGKERRFAWSDGVDAPRFAGFELYSDDRALSLHLTPDLPGTLVEYRYTRRIRDSRLETFAQHFEGEFPERRARLTVIAPTGWQIDSEARRLDQVLAFAPKMQTAGGLTTWTWEQHEMPAQTEEALAPARHQTAISVAVRLARWSERGTAMAAPADMPALSAWLYDLTRPPAATEAPRELARSLVRDLPNEPALRARTLYSWVRDHISYCAIEIGLGGWQPHGASDVFRHRYGDCKDKANLLHEMLAAVGGSSDLVVLFAHEGMPEPFDLVTRRTNHAILRVHLPTGNLLADPTSPVTPFGALPLSDQEADYLPLVAGGAALGRAPSSSAEENTREIVLDVAPRDGELVGALHATAQGYFADWLRVQLMRVRHDDQAKPILEGLELGRWHLSAWHVDGAAPPESPTAVGAKGLVRLPHAWPATRVRLLSAANLLGSAVPPLPRAPREAPLVLRCRQRLVEHVRIALDDAVEAALPSPTVIESPVGRYELGWSRGDGKLRLERSLVVNEHIFPASAYREVREFFDAILAADARAITIRGGSE